MNLYKFIKEEYGLNLKNKCMNTGMLDAVKPLTLSFLNSNRFLMELNNNNNLVCMFVDKNNAEFIPKKIEYIVVENPKALFFEVHNAYYKKYMHYESNNIAKTASISPQAYIAPFGVTIGENVIIGPNTTIFSGVEIGNYSVVGANCVIGSEGFHVFADRNGVNQIVLHDGSVKIGSNVDIMSAVTIDKGLMGRDTVVGDNSKIDNLVHIAHRVHIGAKVLVAASACIAGSAEIGDKAWIGPNSTISNRIKIGAGARVLLGSVVIRNVKQGEEVSGNFAVNHHKHILQMKGM